ncbi:MAG: hypothetical protein AAFR17_13200, partial [Pseudomonadota bacterium]
EAYHGNPVRHVFTKRFSELQQGTSLDITLPRGSREIHFFTVVAQSLGGLDSPWPNSGDAGDRLITIAAPQIAKPQPPILEVRRIPAPGDPAGFAVQVQVTPRIGHRARRMRLFRTRLADAARRIDTMGPPIAVIEASGSGWEVTTDSDEQFEDFITEVSGIDMPEGSWRRVWYRAEIWSDAVPERALLAGRSNPSPAQHVVIPPNAPPPLTPIESEWPGGASGNILFKWSSPVPVAPTPLGPHRMSLEVRAPGGAGLAQPLLAADGVLSGLPPGLPPATSGWWRHGAPGPDGTQEYRAILYRDSAADPLSVAVRLHDPLGRITERLLRVPGVPVLQPPVISDVIQLDLGPDMMGFAITSPSPIEAGEGGAYALSITATLAASQTLQKAITPQNESTVLAPRTLSQPNTIRPPQIGIQPRPGPRQLRISADLPDIKIQREPPKTAPRDALLLWRAITIGSTRSYRVATGARISRVTVRLTAPDGRYTEETREVR